MRIGIPKEIRPGEYRVAGLPKHVAQLKELGADVVVQRGAGERAGASDDMYLDAGAALADALEEVYETADIVWKVKELMPAEFGLLRPEHVLYSYLHPIPRPDMVRAMLDAGCIGITYEDMTDDEGRRPLLAPMSRIAGAGAVALAAQFSQSLHRGCAKLLFRTEGAEPMRFCIVGGGVAGRSAAKAALAAGAEVEVLEIAKDRLPALAAEFPAAKVHESTPETLRQGMATADVLVNCAHWLPGDPRLITREMLALMRPGSLIMDIAADTDGAIETSVETTHDDPVYAVEGILHCCIQNIPSLYARTASHALSSASWPELERMVRIGVEAAIKESGLLRRGVCVWRGQAVGKRLGETQGIAAVEPDELLRVI